MAVAGLSADELALFAGKLKVEPGTGVTDQGHMGRIMAYLINNPATARSLLPLGDAIMVPTLAGLVPSGAYVTRPTP